MLFCESAAVTVGSPDCEKDTDWLAVLMNIESFDATQPISTNNKVKVTTLLLHVLISLLTLNEHNLELIRN